MANLVSLMTHKRGPKNYVEWFGFSKDEPGVGRNIAVVWVEYQVDPVMGVYLHTIETRPGYRQRGYASKVLELLKASYSVPEIRHNGSYTPEGFEYIYPRVSWVRDGFVEEPRIGFRSMDFVENWEKYENHLK